MIQGEASVVGVAPGLLPAAVRAGAPLAHEASVLALLVRPGAAAGHVGDVLTTAREDLHAAAARESPPLGRRSSRLVRLRPAGGLRAAHTRRGGHECGCGPHGGRSHGDRAVVHGHWEEVAGEGGVDIGELVSREHGNREREHRVRRNCQVRLSRRRARDGAGIEVHAAASTSASSGSRVIEMRVEDVMEDGAGAGSEGRRRVDRGRGVGGRSGRDKVGLIPLVGASSVRFKVTLDHLHLHGNGDVKSDEEINKSLKLRSTEGRSEDERTARALLEDGEADGGRRGSGNRGGARAGSRGGRADGAVSAAEATLMSHEMIIGYD